MADAAKSLISKISDRYRDRSDEKSKARDSLGFNRYDVNYSFCAESLCASGCVCDAPMSAAKRKGLGSFNPSFN